MGNYDARMEWVFWVGNSSYRKVGYHPFTTNIKECFRCSVTAQAIEIHFSERVRIAVSEIAGCLVVPASFEVPRSMVQMYLKGQDQVAVLYLVNPVQPHGWGKDGDSVEAGSFVAVVNHLVLGADCDVHPNPYYRHLLRSGRAIPEIVFTDKYLSPFAFASAGVRPPTLKSALLAIGILVLGAVLVMLLAYVATLAAG